MGILVKFRGHYLILPNDFFQQTILTYFKLSVRPKPPIWFQSDTETETENWP